MESYIKVLVFEPGKNGRFQMIENTPKTMQELIGGNIEILYPFQHNPGIALICHKKGKLLRLEPTVMIDFDQNDINCGTCFLCGAPLDSEDFTSLPNDFLAEFLWHDLEDVPVDENECIDIPWQDFPKGTHREEIWHWVEETFNVSVAMDLMGLEK